MQDKSRVCSLCLKLVRCFNVKKIKNKEQNCYEAEKQLILVAPSGKQE